MAIDAVTSGVVAATTGAVDGPKVAHDSQAAVVVGKLAAAQPARSESHAAVQAAVKQIDSYLRSAGREVEFHVDEATGTTVVTVRETATGTVIRQIPNDEVLQLARHIDSGSHALLDLTV
jgi:flagellar protein FlaG